MILDEIGAKLAALSLGTVGTDIFLGIMPATPDACCAVFEYGGNPPEMGFGTPGVRYESPAVQVVFRGASTGSDADYTAPRTKAETAYRGLAAVMATSLSGTPYLTITPQQSPFLLDRDDSGRARIACNFICMKEPS